MRKPLKHSELRTGIVAVLAAAVWLGTVIASAAQTAQTPPPGASPDTAVTLDDQVLFYIRAPLGAFSAVERARTAEQRILRIAGDPLYSEDLFALRAEGSNVTALYRNEIIGFVTPDDAVGTPGGPTALASEVLVSVKAAIERHRARLLPAQRLRAAIILGFSTLLLAGAIFALSRLFRARAALIAARRHRTVAHLQQQLLRLAFVVLSGVLLFIYLETAFAVIPLTRAYAVSLLDYVVQPLQALLNAFRLHVTDFFFIIVVIVLTKMLLRLLRWALDAASAGAIAVPFVSAEWATPLYKIVRILVVIVSALTIYPYIPGSSTDAFKGIGLVGGALLTLGASGTAGNFIGGLVLVFSETFRLGDIIQVGNVRGAVVETNLLLTRIRTPKNDVVTIPNSSIMSGQLVNYSTQAREDGLILHTAVTIGYDTPWRTVHQLLIDAALKTADIVPTPAPFVLQTSLNNFFVTYEINAFTRNPERMSKIYGTLHENIQDAFNAAGVEIVSPHFTSLRDGNATTVPEHVDQEPRRFAVSLEPPQSSI